MKRKLKKETRNKPIIFSYVTFILICLSLINNKIIFAQYHTQTVSFFQNLVLRTALRKTSNFVKKYTSKEVSVLDLSKMTYLSRNTR